MPDYSCDECGESFEDAFEMVDHNTPEGEEEFDPSLILPNGYHLHIGSLLRFFYHHANDPEQVKQISQSTYVTLFAAEHNLDMLSELIEEVVVKSEMLRFDDSLKELLEDETNDEGGA